MKKYSKAGLLIVTLVIPALIFTFLRFFATNHYNIPHYFPLTDTKGDVRMNGKDTLFYKVESLKVQNPFKGKLTVVHYQPEICEDSCEIVLANLERIYDLRTGIKSINLVTVCDSITNVSNIKSSSIHREGWSVLKLSPENLKNVLFEELKFQTEIPKAKTNSVKSKLVLIDEEEHIRGYYNGFDKEEIDRLMAEIKILDFEKESVSQ